MTIVIAKTPLSLTQQAKLQICFKFTDEINVKRVGFADADLSATFVQGSFEAPLSLNK